MPTVNEPNLADTMQEVVQKVGELHLLINKLDAEIRVLQLFAQDHHKRLVELEEITGQQQSAAQPSGTTAAPMPDVDPASVKPPPELVQFLGAEYRDYQIETEKLIELAYRAGYAKGRGWS